jgi:hypothetical protein
MKSCSESKTKFTDNVYSEKGNLSLISLWLKGGGGTLSVISLWLKGGRGILFNISLVKRGKGNPL